MGFISDIFKLNWDDMCLFMHDIRYASVRRRGGGFKVLDSQKFKTPPYFYRFELILSI